MKFSAVVFSLLLGGLSLVAPQAKAQSFGMDQQYQNSLEGQRNQVAFASSSTAATGTQSYGTSVNAWQDMAYVQGQQQARRIPGTLQAPLQATPYGTASTYTGNTGQFIQGKSQALGSSLPKTAMNSQAIQGRYTGRACAYDGPGGFPTTAYTSRKYPNLPMVATSLDCTLNNVEYDVNAARAQAGESAVDPRLFDNSPNGMGTPDVPQWFNEIPQSMQGSYDELRFMARMWGIPLVDNHDGTFSVTDPFSGITWTTSP